ncbi:expressed unknown protein [Seminavis robusta]|uniref:Uncharacterized protein n=1 Tax=Seminavis robusta TaxID=568900 RepID=A0A9N8HSU9_9STRA|nr:expressed unknown protein [Seminavis robusta]|eukprot:Sro1493_g277310.1 n/a (131) ;mRNA; r:15506-15898
MVVGRDIFNTGSQVDPSEKITEPAKIMDLAAGLHTNKLVFDNEHNNYFDTLQFGYILAIPIFKSLELLGDWKYQEPYEMLVVCDRHQAYQRLAIINIKGHIKDVTESDVGHATDLLHMTTRMLAESFNHW